MQVSRSPRVLLIDCHDSFTLNLAHDVAAVTGELPRIVTHDDPTPVGELLAGVDVVILSPGPGHPAVPDDVGIAPAVVSALAGAGYEHVVLLGVCLGHQLLAHLAGAEVTRAPEPRHGRLARVTHDGQGIFAGLPQPMTVTRYHSLAVADPEHDGAGQATGWRVTARSEDGVVQAMAHTSRPWVAVQFHPESIATVGGRQLMANVLAMAVPAQRLAVRSVPFRAGDDAVAEQLVETLAGSAEVAVWLDSRGDRATSRWSVLALPSNGRVVACAPACAEGESEDAGCTPTGCTPAGGALLRSLQRRLDDTRVDLGAFDPAVHGPFALGWAGWLGYELREQTAPAAGASRHPATWPGGAPAPLAQMAWCDRAVVLDRATDAAHVLTLEPTGALPDDLTSAADQRVWADTAVEALTAVIEPGPTGGDDAAQALPVIRLEGVTRADDEAAYRALIDRAHEAIAAGESYEICLTTQVTGTLRADGAADDLPWQAYRLLRRANPVPFGAWLRVPGGDILSMSPERFVMVTREGQCLSSPIKGTRPRGATPADDDALRHDLATAEKDRAENLMIVDLVRHDLGRCAEPGSVHVDPLFDVETYSTVHQLVSTVRARRRGDLAATDVIAACFPPGSMTGAPKVRTMQLIDAWESGARGVYSGAIGWLGLDGAADFSVVIRTLVVGPAAADGSHPATYGVGGAIVALSDTEAELAELDTKTTPLRPLL